MSDQGTITQLMAQRDKVFNLLQVRKALGSFDANSDALVALNEAVLTVLNYLIIQEEKSKSKK